ncbi:hypothetical protein [Methylobacterium sp. Leaf125]|uniref:hypothetical protein n=1 Tax=Methylobacterium sp. Leaf125 TaxID=1736265 RepID=UPI000A700DD3|nr:hypothetical protein [Methylobacterium sp. Leaf125]
MPPPKSSKKVKKAKKTVSPQLKAELRTKNQHIKLARNLFRNIGFTRIAQLSDKEFEFKGIKSDFDDIFIHENVVVVAEYTTSSESNVSDHLKKKNYIYQAIYKDPEVFVEFLKEKYPSISSLFLSKYANHHFQVRAVYCSLNTIKSETKSQVIDISFLDYNVLRYFENVSGTIKYSAKYEFLAFLSVEAKNFGSSVIATTAGSGDYYSGSVLPGTHSHFPKGFKVVSFYVDASALLSRAYVLRRDGWRDESDIYQRMILRSKVEGIRKHLLDGNNVFVNNIIVTLPSNSQLVTESNTTIDVADIKKTTPGKVNLPVEYNSIGLIDG